MLTRTKKIWDFILGEPFQIRLRTLSYEEIVCLEEILMEMAPNYSFKVDRQNRVINVFTPKSNSSQIQDFAKIVIRAFLILRRVRPGMESWNWRNKSKR